MIIWENVPFNQFFFSNIKPKDAVVVGMFPKELDQIALNVQCTKRACGNFDPSIFG
ncbi:MAG: hypothetical protein ABFS38_14800 [Bacteroidota bacterium]